MNYRILGKSDLSISEVSFGCMSLNPAEATVSIRLLNLALDKGITFFDTADLYDKGENEKLVGQAFKGKREQVIIATKAGNQWRPDGSGWDWNPRKEYLLQAVEKSLTRLKTDYLDLYQLHGGTLEDPVDETIEAFERLQQQGKIRYYGISSIRPNVIREYVKRSNIVSVMMQYSLLDRRPEETCLELLHNHHIGVLARGGLAQGLLAGKPAKPYLNFSEEEVQNVYAALQKISKTNQQPPEIALQFILKHPAISSAVLGIRTDHHLATALKAATSTPLDPDNYNYLKQIITPNFYEQHR